MNVERKKKAGFPVDFHCLCAARISGSANPQGDFVIATQGEMASFPAGTTPFFLEIESAQGVLCKKFPARSMTQLTSSIVRPLFAVPLFRGARCENSERPFRFQQQNS
jgi:hypothetical protein